MADKIEPLSERTLHAPNWVMVPHMRREVIFAVQALIEQANAKAEAKPDAKAEAKPEAKAAAKPEAKAAAKPEAKSSTKKKG